MFFRSVLKSLKPRPSAAPVRRSTHQPPAPRLRVEVLEDRSLPSVTVSLAPNEPAPQLVGEAITWIATTAGIGATPVYQFSVAPHGGTFQMVRDFSPANSFAWTPMQEGNYDIEVAVKDGYQATATTTAVVADTVASRVSGSQPVVTATSNPLVALYSAAPSSAATVFVQFAVASDHPAWRDTDARPAVAGKSTNFFVAGMLPDTTYEMRDVRSDGTGSAPLFFTTGNLPSNLAFPSFTEQPPTDAGADLDQDMLFHQFPNAPSNVPNPLATDLGGNVVWYYDVSKSGFSRTYVGQSLAPGGTVLVLGVDRYAPLPGTLDALREVDLAGDPVRETNIDAVNAQLAARGMHSVFTFSHDVERLPNGQTAVIAPTERTINVNGTPTEYVGMTIVVLDQNFQLSWAWDAFDHLDVTRGPVLGEILQPSGADQLTASTPVLSAVDWLHVNAVSWSPGDQNLVLSVRHQDWVIKIDYANGAGDGHVIWRLGQGGDFAVNSTDPNPWFSHQHDAHFIDDHTLILFDNGNTRRAGDPTADSRGQVWTLDEKTMKATLVMNVDVGSYSPMFGAAQRLSNGDYEFLSGAQGRAPNLFGQTIEVRPDGSRDYVLRVNQGEYRSFRVRTLYEGVDDALAGAPLKVESVVVNDGGAQRSMVNSVTVTFNGAAILDPGAIELRRQDGTLVSARVSISLLGGKTVAVLTFAGPGFVGGSLADGSYTLTVRADRTHDRWGRELDGDGDGSSGDDRVFGFFRLFGDADGDGHLGRQDRDLFRSAFKTKAGQAGYLWYFDFDGDGAVDGQDNGQFNRRFGQ